MRFRTWLRRLFRDLALAFGALALLVGALVWGGARLWRQLEVQRCGAPSLIDAQLSPDGGLVAERYLLFGACEQSYRALALRRLNETFDETSDVFATFSDEPVLYKWIGEERLLIGLPKDLRLDERRDQVGRTKLTYTAFGNDPDAGRDPTSMSVLRKTTRYEADFEKRTTQTFVSCKLNLRVEEGSALSRIDIRFSGGRTFAQKSGRAAGAEIIPPEAFGDLLITGHSSYPEPKKWVTAAAFDGITPSTRDPEIRTSPITTPSGACAPDFAIWYRRLSRQQVDQIIARLRVEPLLLKLGFWMDNEEWLLKADNLDRSTLNAFERCLTEEQIFDGASQDEVAPAGSTPTSDVPTAH